jgi:hypothetical protein
MWTSPVDELIPNDGVDSIPPYRRPAADTQTWGVHPAAYLAGVVLAVGGLAWAFLTPSSEDRLVAWGLTVFAVFASFGCLLMRRRLTVEPRRMVVRGPGGVRTYPWTSVVDVEVVRRSRLGVASSTLEVDLDDDGLIVLGRFDLGADPVDVAKAVRTHWFAARR